MKMPLITANQSFDRGKSPHPQGVSVPLPSLGPTGGSTFSVNSDTRAPEGFFMIPLNSMVIWSLGPVTKVKNRTGSNHLESLSFNQTPQKISLWQGWPIQ